MRAHIEGGFQAGAQLIPDALYIGDYGVNVGNVEKKPGAAVGLAKCRDGDKKQYGKAKGLAHRERLFHGWKEWMMTADTQKYGFAAQGCPARKARADEKAVMF